MIRFPMGNVSVLGDDATLAARQAARLPRQEYRSLMRYFPSRQNSWYLGYTLDCLFEARCTISLLGKEAL